MWTDYKYRCRARNAQVFHWIMNLSTVLFSILFTFPWKFSKLSKPLLESSNYHCPVFFYLLDQHYDDWLLMLRLLEGVIFFLHFILCHRILAPLQGSNQYSTISWFGNASTIFDILLENLASSFRLGSWNWKCLAWFRWSCQGRSKLLMGPAENLNNSQNQTKLRFFALNWTHRCIPKKDVVNSKIK